MNILENDLYLVYGQTKSGKTKQLIEDSIRYHMSGAKVALVSLDTSESMVFSRIGYYCGTIDYPLESLFNSKSVMYTISNQIPGDVDEFIEENEIIMNRVDIMFLDDVYLLTSEYDHQGFDNSRDFIFRRLSQTAKEHSLAIIATVQAKRNSYDKRIHTSTDDRSPVSNITKFNTGHERSRSAL